jgi:hypothetical protein
MVTELSGPWTLWWTVGQACVGRMTAPPYSCFGVSRDSEGNGVAHAAVETIDLIPPPMKLFCICMYMFYFFQENKLPP